MNEAKKSLLTFFSNEVKMETSILSALGAWPSSAETDSQGVGVRLCRIRAWEDGGSSGSGVSVTQQWELLKKTVI